MRSGIFSPHIATYRSRLPLNGLRYIKHHGNYSVNSLWNQHNILAVIYKNKYNTNFIQDQAKAGTQDLLFYKQAHASV